MNAEHVNAYLRTQVLTAPPEQLRMMLLDGAARFARQGLEGFERGDHEATFEGVSQCRAIVLELLTTVSEEAAPELAGRVRSVYTFLYGELMEIPFSRDAERLRKVIDLLEYERETWRLVIEKLQSERSGRGRESCGEPGGKECPLSVQA